MNATKRLFKLNINRVITILPFCALVVAAASVGGACYKLRWHQKNTSSSSVTVSELSSSIESTKETTINYISETNYKGHLAQFPELYEIPFQKSDAYICNKDFYKAYYGIFEECENDATAFVETLFNVNYRDIAADQLSFITDVMQNGDYETFITKNYGTEDETTIYLYDYIKEISEYYIENQIEMEAKFYTDDSLVYSDFYIFVRGELVFTIYNSADQDSKYEVGEEYQIPIEVAMQRSPSNPSNRTVCSFGEASDNTFFLIP